MTWDQQRTGNFFVSTNSGLVFCLDFRTSAPVYRINAHSDAVTGVCQSVSTDCLVTVSADKTLKVWNIGSTERASLVLEHPRLRVGRLLSLAPHPESPFVFAVGGDASSNNYRVVDISSFKAVKQSFNLSA